MTLKRIMLIDDDLAMRKMGDLALRVVGKFDLKTCESGEEALREVKGFMPELILLDVMMPNMDGIETLKNIRSIPEVAHVPIVFLTAQSTSEEIANLLKHGAFGTIQKPYNPKMIASQIHDLWAKRSA